VAQVISLMKKKPVNLITENIPLKFLCNFSGGKSPFDRDLFCCTFSAWIIDIVLFTFEYTRIIFFFDSWLNAARVNPYERESQMDKSATYAACEQMIEMPFMRMPLSKLDEILERLEQNGRLTFREHQSLLELARRQWRVNAVVPLEFATQPIPARRASRQWRSH
jgi:hypothetical protein